MSDRRHLVSAEVEKLLAAVKGTRNAVRDRCLLLLMFRHGLRVSEACGLKLSGRRAAGDQGMAGGTGQDEARNRRVLYQ